ncbi:MAG: hypothetical protein ACTSYS_10060, partial [Promethearchaeota archaeon]
QAHLDEIVQLMVKENCTLIVTDPQHSDRNAIEIARSVSGAKIATMTAIPGLYEGFNVTDYISMIHHCIWALKNPEDPPDLFIPGYSMSWMLFIMAFLVFAQVTRMKRRYLNPSN